MDVLNSEYLRQVFALRNRDMAHLTGIAPNQIRIYGGIGSSGWQGDEIDIVLAIAAVYLEFKMAQIAACVDASTSSPVGHMVKAKAERSFEGVWSSFSELREIVGIP